MRSGSKKRSGRKPSTSARRGASGVLHPRSLLGRRRGPSVHRCHATSSPQAPRHTPQAPRQTRHVPRPRCLSLSRRVRPPRRPLSTACPCLRPPRRPIRTAFPGQGAGPSRSRDAAPSATFRGKAESRPGGRRACPTTARRSGQTASPCGPSSWACSWCSWRPSAPIADPLSPRSLQALLLRSRQALILGLSAYV